MFILMHVRSPLIIVFWEKLKATYVCISLNPAQVGYTFSIDVVVSAASQVSFSENH